jgi:hypothetical protein
VFPDFSPENKNNFNALGFLVSTVTGLQTRSTGYQSSAEIFLIPTSPRLVLESPSLPHSG